MCLTTSAACFQAKAEVKELFVYCYLHKGAKVAYRMKNQISSHLTVLSV